MAYNEEDYLQLSGLQHFSFCRRQWALIHIEQQWLENLRTADGRILHEKAHDSAWATNTRQMKKRTDLLNAHKVQKIFCTLLLSHPARGGWIEIKCACFSSSSAHVPPRTGWVD